MVTSPGTHAPRSGATPHGTARPPPTRRYASQASTSTPKPASTTTPSGSTTPKTARYLTPDPLGLTPAANPAAYVHNPLTWCDPLGLSPYRELGLSDEATNAIQKLENIKHDPIGRINSDPNHNHYSAARREAAGEVVARKADGTPFDHIKDLTQAQQGLENVRKVLWKEMERLPEGMTDRGLEVLIKKYDETVYHLDRVKGFLHQIKQQ